jgi:hypothetical protein
MAGYLVGELRDVAGQGFDLPLHSPDRGGKLVSFLGRLIGAGLRLYAGFAFTWRATTQSGGCTCAEVGRVSLCSIHKKGSPTWRALAQLRNV